MTKYAIGGHGQQKILQTLKFNLKNPSITERNLSCSVSIISHSNLVSILL